MDRRQFVAGAAAFVGGMSRAAPQAFADSYVDGRTGHRVWVLARGSASGLYFHQNPFTASGEKMVYRAPTPEGAQAFVFDFRTQTSCQLTREPGGTGSEIVGARTRRLYYRAGLAIKSVHLDTLDVRHLCDLPGDLSAYPYALSPDERTLASGYVEGGEEIAKLPRGEMFVRMFDAKLRNVIYTIDIETGRYQEIYEENTWLGHFQYSPAGPNTLMFCHEGPWERLDRIWLLDVAKRESRLVYRRRREGEIAGHEFWHPDGRRVWFDLRHRADREFALANVNLATGELTAYPLKPEEWSVHYNIEPRGRWLCGDGGEEGPWIYLFTPQGDGTVKVTRLCSLEGHSYPRREPNVHVTPDRKWVVFTTNMAGETQVRAVSVSAEEG